MILLVISFIAGLLTVLAPCILPLIPVIIGHSVADTNPSRRRLFVVVASLCFSIIIFTLLLKSSSTLINIPQEVWSYISGGIILFFGLTMVYPKIWEQFYFTSEISIKSNIALGKGYIKNNILGDIIIGASLGPIFSACSPTYFVILATVLPVSYILGIIYLLTYVIGLSIALIVVAILGQRIIGKLGNISDPNSLFKKILGIIFILTALSIISGYDKKIQIALLNAGFFDVTKIEQKLLEIRNISSLSVDSNTKSEKEIFPTLLEKTKKYKLAPEISTPDGFINTNDLPITISEFKGKKIVLLDIWTYSCINCQRTIPYLNEWYKKYEDKGLVIIGLHTPEFAFERLKNNVERAVQNLGIKYPVVLDNDFSTWNAYNNQYWPRKYLIDIDGYIVYDHAGEGQYEDTEAAIQKAINERLIRLKMDNTLSSSRSNPVGVTAVDFAKVGSPETYFGSSRNYLLHNGEPGITGKQLFSIPSNITLNKLYLKGEWNITPEYAENNDSAEITYSFDSKNVYITAGSDKSVKIKIYQDEMFIKEIEIKENQLYSLIQNESYGKHILKIVIPTAGLKAFTFTFG